MSLSCETCDALLIDLVERELDDGRAAEVRAHAQGCESCGRALVRLEAGRRAASELTRAEPPRLDAVFAAARARAAESRAARAEPATPSEIASPTVAASGEPAESWLDGVVRWLGTWAARPQVAMATLLLLMVGIGLWHLPQFRGRDVADPDGALVEPDPHAELGVSPALDPAEPLELDVDPRTQRVALGGADEAEEPNARDDRPTTQLAPHEETTVAQRDRVAEPALAGALHADTPLEAERTERTPSGGDALAVTDVAPAEAVGRVEEGALPDLGTPTTTESAIVVAPAPEPSTPSTAPPRVATAPHPTTTPSAPSGPRSSTPSAPARDEVTAETPSAVDMLPAAILRQARALASAGHCDQAAPRYRTLLAEHPELAEGPRATLELADCERRLGHLDSADHLLAQAERYPSVSAEARRMRVQVETATRAARAAAPSSSTPSSEASSAYSH